MIHVRICRVFTQILSPPHPLRDEGCCRVTRTPRSSQVQAGRWGTRPGASGRHGPRIWHCRGNHAPTRRRHRHCGIQLWRHAGEREGAGEAAAATAAELRSVRQPAETEAAQDAFHAGAAQRAGAQLRKNPLPWHLHEGRAGTEDRPHWVQSSGKYLDSVDDVSLQHENTGVMWQGVALRPE